MIQRQTDPAAALAAIPAFAGLSPEARARLLPRARVRVVARNGSIWSEDDDADEFVFVVRGRAKLVRADESGRIGIIDLVAPGDLVCAAPCARERSCCTALALTEVTEVISLPREDLLALLETEPSAVRPVLAALTERGVSACQRVSDLSGGPVERRIARLLIRLAREGGAGGDAGTRVPVALSRQEIAELCGTTIETAIRTMTKLARRGVVRTLPDGFVIDDPWALERLARGQP